MNIYDVFKKLDIKYNEIEHQPLYTIADTEIIKGKIKWLTYLFFYYTIILGDIHEWFI